MPAIQHYGHYGLEKELEKDQLQDRRSRKESSLAAHGFKYRIAETSREALDKTYGTFFIIKYVQFMKTRFT